MKRFSFLPALIFCLVAACGPPFPKDLLDKVDRNVSYDAVHKDPGRFTGSLLMLGGMIVETRNLKDGSRIEVLQKPLDGEGRPRETDETGGRFLITTDRFLDGAVYHRGRLITVIGEGAGRRTLPLGETEYRYPELTAKSIHLWSASEGPRFTFGVGVYRGY